MFRMVRFKREKEAAYLAEQFKRIAEPQRWLLLAGGLIYAFAGIWITLSLGQRGPLLTASAVLMIGALVLWALTYTPFVRNRIEIVPILAALAYGWHTMLGLAFIPQDGEWRTALTFGSLAFLVALMSPTVQAAMAAIVTTALVAALGFGIVFPLQDVQIGLVKSATLAAPLYVLAAGVAMALDHTRREAFAYRYELARRATTDDISGVSNRAHINQLAQNEFGRARRYKEPFSMVMIEIDEFEYILDQRGPIALDTMIQVFAGYCIVLMRSCDSFGRLGPKRFLALLPETPGKGAMVLAQRMCKDFAALDVMTDDETLNFTVSIGAAQAHPDDKWAGDLMRRCAHALDDAIAQGRNTAVLAQVSGQTVANDEAPMVSDGAANMMMPPMAEIAQGPSFSEGPGESPILDPEPEQQRLAG